MRPITMARCRAEAMVIDDRTVSLQRAGIHRARLGDAEAGGDDVHDHGDGSQQQWREQRDGGNHLDAGVPHCGSWNVGQPRHQRKCGGGAECRRDRDVNGGDGQRERTRNGGTGARSRTST